jgi:hypothetical protein
MGPVGVAVGTLGGILLVRLPGYTVAGCRATGMRVSTFLRQTVVPNILPAVGCTAVLLGLGRVPVHSVIWLFCEAGAACVTYLVLFFMTGASPEERQRGLAFITRPLPARWRQHPVVSSSVGIVDDSA